MDELYPLKDLYAGRCYKQDSWKHGFTYNTGQSVKKENRKANSVEVKEKRERENRNLQVIVCPEHSITKNIWIAYCGVCIVVMY